MRALSLHFVSLFLAPILTLCLSSAALECLATLLKTKASLLSDVLRSGDLYDALFRQIKYHGNTVPLAQPRVSLFHCLESLITGVGFGHAIGQVHETMAKIFKYWASCTERSLQVRAAAARCLAVWVPYAASSYAAIGVVQSIVFKELSTSPAFGHTYGVLLYTALKESHAKEAVQPVQNLPPPKPGAPPHDSLGILGYKEYESLEAILEHTKSVWLKTCGKREARESVAATLVSFYSRVSFQYVEKKLPLIIAHLLSFVSLPNLKLYAAGELTEAKSSVSYILHAGILANCTEDGKRLLFKELLTQLEQSSSVADSQSTPLDLSRISMILAEIYSLFAELGESLVPVVTTSGSGSTIEDIIWKLLQQQQVTIGSSTHRNVFATAASSPSADGHMVWLWAGLVLKRFCAVNDQFFVPVEKLLSMMPAPVGSAPAHHDPMPVAWAFGSTKRTRPTSSAEFGAILSIAQALIAGPATPANTPNAPSAASWSTAGWILLASLLQRGSGQSAEQDRASVVSSHLATLQQLWKQELSKRPVSDADLVEFAHSKLWLLYTLKHFLGNFSRLVHESNLTTFTTQCLNTVLKSVTTWQGTNTTTKSERDSSAIDALIVALLQSYTTLATHIFNPPSVTSPRAGSQPSNEATPASFPARSVLQMIAKQLVRPRYLVNTWMIQKYLNIEDESLDFNLLPCAGTLPSSSTLFTDLHGCTSTISHASGILWSDWSNALFLTRANRARSGGSNNGAPSPSFVAAQLSTTNADDAVLYMPPSAQLMSEMSSIFPPLFHQQLEAHQTQLISFLASCVTGSSNHAGHANVLLILLAIAKENAKLSGSHQLGTLMMMSPGTATQSKPLTKAVLAQVAQIAEAHISSSIPFIRRLASDILAAAIDSYEANALVSSAKSLHGALWNCLGFNATTPTNQMPQASQSMNQLLKAQATIEGTLLTVGSIHRAVGGIRSRQFMSDTIKVLSAVIRITFETRPAVTSSNPASPQQVSLHRAALHALWISLEATGLTDTSFASSTLSTMLDCLISDVSREWQTTAHLGCIVGSIAAVLGPELQGSISLLRRLQGAIVLLDCVGSMEIEDAPVSYNYSTTAALSNDWVPPRTLAPTCLAYSASIALRERLLLFAPQFIDAKRSSVKLLAYVRSIRRNTDFEDGSRDAALLSPVSYMRLNALRVLRFLAQLNPQAFQEDIFVRNIVHSPDREPLDSSVRAGLRTLISTLEETLVPLDPLKWLSYASYFVMGAESDVKLSLPSNTPAAGPAKSTAAAKPIAAATATAKKTSFASADDDDEPEGDPLDETEEEMAGINTLSAPVIERINGADDDSIWTLSSSLAALFVSSLHYVFEPLKSQPAHFEAVLAAQKKAQAAQKGLTQPTFLVDSLPGVVSLASKASSAPMASLQIAGLEGVHDILERFAEAADPQLRGHYLLELYVAQMSAALRRCIARESPVANRVCHASYVVLAEMIIWIAKHVQDVAGLRQLLRPFLDANLERSPLHTQRLANDASSDAESDSPIALELNPRYVAWLMASALLWEGSNSLESKAPNVKPTAQSTLPGIAYLQTASADENLRRSLCRGWMAILEYRAVQQYSQDLTQLTIFGSSSLQGAAKRDILGQATTLGIDWCQVLLAMCSQFAEHAWSTVKAAKEDATTLHDARADVSRSAHIIFGLILHNLANVSHISDSLKALQSFMKGLIQLDTLGAQEDGIKEAMNLLPLPAAAIAELCQALANLLSHIHYREYTQKAQLLETTTATVQYLASHNRLFATDPTASIPAITHSFFQDAFGDAANQIVLKEILLESLEHGEQFAPSTRHTAAYLASVLKSLAVAWPLLNPSEEQHARVALWLSKVITLETPDLPAAQVQTVLVPLALDCWQAVASSSLDMCASLVNYAISRVDTLTEGGWKDEKSVLEARFWASALVRTASSALNLGQKDFHASTDSSSAATEEEGGDRVANLASLALSRVTSGDLAVHGQGIPTIRAFIQKGLAGGDPITSKQSAASVLATVIPTLFERFLALDRPFDASTATPQDMEIRQELLKLTILLQQNVSSGALSGAEDHPHAGLALVLSALCRLLSRQQLPANAPYNTIHDSSLSVLLHLAQTQQEQFKASFGLIDAEERAAFESSVRARMERQQAIQAAQAAPKAKFSLDTSQYSK